MRKSDQMAEPSDTVGNHDFKGKLAIEPTLAQPRTAARLAFVGRTSP